MMINTLIVIHCVVIVPSVETTLILEEKLATFLRRLFFEQSFISFATSVLLAVFKPTTATSRK